MNRNRPISEQELDYLRLLAKEYPNEQVCATEIINLNAILGLPKPTEHFMSDLHGEYEAFTQIMRSASGAIREKIDMLYQDSMSSEERAELATLIYYPKEKMKQILPWVNDKTEWYVQTLHYLIEICHSVSFKYTRSKVRKALPEEYAYVIDELLNADFTMHNKMEYYDTILNGIIEVGKAEDFICAMCNVINYLIVDKIHIIGDIYDRGPRADYIMDSLMDHHNVDIQWGNHDIIWMGAAAGSPVCILTVLSNSILYHNLDVIEFGYGISLRPLYIFANDYYGLTDVTCFATRIMDPKDLQKLSEVDLERTARMSKATDILLFKLMGQVISRNPDFQMDDRLLLNNVDYDLAKVEIDGKTYSMHDCDFPTVDISHPYHITEAEQNLIDELVLAFKSSERLQRHVRYLYSNGNMYKKYNGNLLFHGGIPMDPDGNFTQVEFDGELYSGKRLLDYCEKQARNAYHAPEGSSERLKGMDFCWYLWCGPNSPLYARSKMTTFERRFLSDKSTWAEQKNPYYQFINTAEGCEKILQEFGLTADHCHIINGHVPVRSKDGESPVKGNGKLIVIDGGFSKAYQKTTGIAGYTLIYNSRHMAISAHEPFAGKETALKQNKDIVSSVVITEELDHRIKIRETDIGQQLQKNVDYLKQLIEAYRQGYIQEQHRKKG